MIYIRIWLSIYAYICVYIHAHTHTYITVQNNNWGNVFFFAKGEKPSWKCNKTQMTCAGWGEISLKFH